MEGLSLFTKMDLDMKVSLELGRSLEEGDGSYLAVVKMSNSSDKLSMKMVMRRLYRLLLKLINKPMTRYSKNVFLMRKVKNMKFTKASRRGLKTLKISKLSLLNTITVISSYGNFILKVLTKGSSEHSNQSS